MASIFQIQVPGNQWMPDGTSQGPNVEIRLGQHGYSIDGSITLGPTMTTAYEVDQTVDSLIRELERLRVQAKRELADQR